MTPVHFSAQSPWNKCKLVGQKAPLQIREVWAIRTRLQLKERARELAPFNLRIDSKLRGCDLVSLRVRDTRHGDAVASRALVMQQKTGRPVQFSSSPCRPVNRWQLGRKGPLAQRRLLVPQPDP